MEAIHVLVQLGSLVQSVHKVIFGLYLGENEEDGYLWYMFAINQEEGYACPPVCTCVKCVEGDLIGSLYLGESALGFATGTHAH